MSNRRGAEEDDGMSSNKAIWALLATGKSKEPPKEKPVKSNPRDQPWRCRCVFETKKTGDSTEVKSSGTERCPRRFYWRRFAESPDKFVRWIESKHLEKTCPEDYFPIYLLVKLKSNLSRVLLRELMLNFSEVNMLWLNPHECLKAACEHLGIPWNVDYASNEDTATETPTVLLMEEEFDDDKRIERFIGHIKNVISSLLQEIFFYIGRTSILQLLELLNNINLDLLKLNKLSQNEYLFSFNTDWVMEFLEKNTHYRTQVFIPKPSKVELDTGVLSITFNVHTKGLSSIEARLENKRQGGDGQYQIASLYDFAAQIDINKENTSPLDEQVNQVDPVENVKINLDDELDDPALQDIANMWDFSYVQEFSLDPFAGQGDVCDCGDSHCQGCFTTCFLCHSKKCAVLCRNKSKFFYGDLVAKNVPHLYLSHQQQELDRSDADREIEDRRVKLAAQLKAEKSQRQAQADYEAKLKDFHDEAIKKKADQAGEMAANAVVKAPSSGRGRGRKPKKRAKRF